MTVDADSFTVQIYISFHNEYINVKRGNPFTKKCVGLFVHLFRKY